MKYLVTGATGQLGAKIVEALLARVPADQVAISVRDPQKAAGLKSRGVEIRQCDFDNAALLDQAFAGIERLLIVSTDGDNATRTRQHANAVAAAKRAGVKFIAYTSLAKADTSTIGLAEVHRATEKAIRETGIPFSFLRNNWYLGNEIGAVMAAKAGAPVTTSAGQGRVGWATREDYAQAAAAVLAGPGHENTVYELGGKPSTYEDLAAALGEVLGKEVKVNYVDDEVFRQSLASAGLPEFVVPMLVDFQRAIREGNLDAPSDDLQKLIGRPATSLKDGLKKLADSLG